MATSSSFKTHQLSFSRVIDAYSSHENEVQAYFADRFDQTRASTANRRLTVPRRCYQWALREKHVSTDPTLKLLTARQAPRLPKTLSEAQVEALLAAPNTETPLGLRDRAMLEYDRLYPEYGFAKHKGYPTAAHFAKLREHGPCPIHRRSFSPVAQAERW